MNTKWSWILEGAPAVTSRAPNCRYKTLSQTFPANRQEGMKDHCNCDCFLSMAVLLWKPEISSSSALVGIHFSRTRSSCCCWKCLVLLPPAVFRRPVPCRQWWAARELYGVVWVPITLVPANFSASRYWTLGLLWCLFTSLQLRWVIQSLCLRIGSGHLSFHWCILWGKLRMSYNCNAVPF